MRQLTLGLCVAITLSITTAQAAPPKNLGAGEYLSGAEACLRLRVLQEIKEDRIKSIEKKKSSGVDLTLGSDSDLAEDQEEQIIQDIPIYPLIVKAIERTGLTADECRTMKAPSRYLKILGSPDPL